MNKCESQCLTCSDFCFLLVGSVIGAGIIKLPSEVVRLSKQDGWVSVILASVYPLYIVLVGNYIIKKCPKTSLLLVSKKYLGKFTGTALNSVYLIENIFILVVVSFNLIEFNRIFIVSFVSPIKIHIVTIFLAAYCAYKGLPTLRKINKFTFFLTITLMVFSLAALRYGKLTNIQPVFQSNPSEILKGSKSAIFSYINIEFLLLIYSEVKDEKSIKKYSLISVAIAVIIYTYVVFISIYYLGVDTIPKLPWCFVSVTESVHITIINNFRYVFMLLWNIIIFKTASNIYYIIVLICSDMFHKDNKKLCVVIYAVMILVCSVCKSELMKNEMLEYLFFYIFIFNVLYVSLIAVFIFFKNKKFNKVGS